MKIRDNYYYNKLLFDNKHNPLIQIIEPLLITLEAYEIIIDKQNEIINSLNIINQIKK
jgi:hypothetical protein